MAEERSLERVAPRQPAGNKSAKAEFQRQMSQARDSISHTVEDLKETVEQQYEAVKRTVDGVLDWREQLQQNPIVWSMGALSAGFALGYTLGYSHKQVGKGRRKRSEVARFADSLIDELSAVGNSLVMPSLNSKIKEVFGFSLADILAEISRGKSSAGPQKTSTRRSSRKRLGTTE
jgi:hypothetical protein